MLCGVLPIGAVVPRFAKGCMIFQKGGEMMGQVGLYENSWSDSLSFLRQNLSLIAPANCPLPREEQAGERGLLHLAVQSLPMETAFEERDKVQLGLARHGLQILTRAGGLRILRFVGPDQCGEGALA